MTIEELTDLLEEIKETYGNLNVELHNGVVPTDCYTVDEDGFVDECQPVAVVIN